MSRLHMTLTDRRTWWRLPHYELKPGADGTYDPYNPLYDDPYQGPNIEAQWARPIRFELPERLVPRILDLDVQDPRAVMKFVGKFGLMGVYADDLRAGSMSSPPSWLGEFDPPLPGSSSWVIGWGGIELLSDFQAAVWSIQRAAAIAAELAQSEGFNVRRLMGIPDAHGIWEGPPPGKRAAQHQFHYIINTGLSGFRLRSRQERDGVVVIAEPSLSLFAMACLELSEAAQRGLPWRTCAAPGCGQVFQPKRVDQVFHHISCARAEASRKYRLRQKREKEKV